MDSALTMWSLSCPSTARKSLLLAILLATVTLSGCTAPGDAPPGEDGTDGTDGHPGRYVPWTLGETWSYDMEIRGFDQYTESKLVYYDERGPEYVVGTPHEDEALYHAVFSVHPLLGRIHQGHLSPHEKGVHATMFPFQGSEDTLDDGETWTTRFYDHFLECASTRQTDIPTPDGPQDGYAIACDDPDVEFQLSYSYVAAYKWFTYLDVTDADGTLFALTLTDHGTGHSGPAHFIRAKDLFHKTIDSSGALLTRSETFRVTQEHVDKDRVEGFAISADIQADAGSASIVITDPDGNEIYRRDYEDTTAQGETNIDVVYAAGDKPTQPIGERPQWPAGEYTVELRFTGGASADVAIAGIQDNSGRV